MAMSTNSSVSLKAAALPTKRISTRNQSPADARQTENFLVEKMRTLGTAACPPYHIAFVIGGTSAETNLKTVKLASAHYYDELPTEGNEHGQAFRDIQLEQELLEEAQKLGLGAQFGGKYFARHPRYPSATSRRILPGRHGSLLLR